MRYSVYLATLMYVSDMYYNWENYLTMTGGYQHAAALPGVSSPAAFANAVYVDKSHLAYERLVSALCYYGDWKETAQLHIYT